MVTRCITSNSTHIILEISIFQYRFFNVCAHDIWFTNFQNTATAKVTISDNAAKIKFLLCIGITDFKLALLYIQIRHYRFTNRELCDRWIIFIKSSCSTQYTTHSSTTGNKSINTHITGRAVNIHFGNFRILIGNLLFRCINVMPNKAAQSRHIYSSFIFHLDSKINIYKICKECCTR